MYTKKGFIALTSVLILSAVLLSVSIGVASQSIARADTSFSVTTYHRAYALAELCAEYALIELERTLKYMGDEDIVVSGESCTVHTISGSGSANRVIEVESTVLEHTVKMRVAVTTLYPEAVITSWDVVNNF